MKTGTIGLQHGRSWLARQIQWWLRLYRKINGLPKQTVYNHGFVVINIGGCDLVVESLGHGVTRPIPIEKAYPSLKNVIFLYPTVPYTKREEIAFMKSAINYADPSHKYDFMGLIYQMILILTGKWIGPTGKKARKRMYCFELAATIANEVRPGTFPEEAAVNSEHFLANKNYQICQ